MTNRFPLPWSVEEQNDRFVIRDSNGQTLTNVRFKDHLFTRDEARHIARSMAKLPDLWIRRS
jgi:hypothetical protein